MCIISFDLTPDSLPCVHFRGKQAKYAKEIYAGFFPSDPWREMLPLPFQRKVAPATGTRGVKVRHSMFAQANTTVSQWRNTISKVHITADFYPQNSGMKTYAEEVEPSKETLARQALSKERDDFWKTLATNILD